MQSVSDLAGAALRGLLADQPVTPGKVALAWRLAAGPTLARAARIEWHESGVLHIHGPGSLGPGVVYRNYFRITTRACVNLLLRE